MSLLFSEDDLNDFIGPGLVCSKSTHPVLDLPPKDNEYEVEKEPEELKKVSISLQDCLACAGCITSSEEVLLNYQNYTFFLKSWESLKSNQLLAVSIAPQCRVSLSHYYGISLQEFDLCFTNLLKKYFKALYVVGTQIGRNISITQINEKLNERRLKNIKEPALCAVCPGFVLYTEKINPGLIPFLLNVKSPQQITGSLLKEINENIYHLTIMPCFDKKLEASRNDTKNEVDCVITPKEFVMMLQELKIDIMEFATQNTAIFTECTPDNWDPLHHWGSNNGSASGGYAYQYLLQLKREYPGSKIITLDGKNTDIVEYQLLDLENGSVIASSSELYGFRNIQNMVRKLLTNSKCKENTKLLRKRGPTKDPKKSKIVANPYNTDFIEVMACPSGCINGGGLLNGEATLTGRKKLVKSLSSEYRKIAQLDIYPTRTKQYTYQFCATTQDQSSNKMSLNHTW